MAKRKRVVRHQTRGDHLAGIPRAVFAAAHSQHPSPQLEAAPTPRSGRSITPFLSRMLGAARLDKATYHAIEQDRSATIQAGAIAVLAGFAGARQVMWDDGVSGALSVLVWNVLSWIVFAVIAFFFNAKVLPNSRNATTIGGVLRTTGFALIPNLLLVVSSLPTVGDALWAIVLVWGLIVIFVVLRWVFTIGTWRAIATFIVAAIPALSVAWGTSTLLDKII